MVDVPKTCWLVVMIGRTQCFGTTSQDAAGWLYKEDRPADRETRHMGQMRVGMVINVTKFSLVDLRMKQLI